MKDFKRGRGGRSDRNPGDDRRPGFHNRARFGGRGGNRNFGRREMYRAVCSTCGKSCEVPFRPNGQKPVFCNTCCNNQTRGTSHAPFEARSEHNPHIANSGEVNRQITELKRQVDAAQSKLDRILHLLETPQPARAEVPSHPEPKKKNTIAPSSIRHISSLP